MDMDFRRTLKKRRPKQHGLVRVSAASTVVRGPKRRVAVQERSVKKIAENGLSPMLRQFIFQRVLC